MFTKKNIIAFIICLIIGWVINEIGDYYSADNKPVIVEKKVLVQLTNREDSLQAFILIEENQKDSLSKIMSEWEHKDKPVDASTQIDSSEIKSRNEELQFYVDNYVLYKNKVRQYEKWFRVIDTNLVRQILINNKAHSFTDSTFIKVPLLDDSKIVLRQHASGIAYTDTLSDSTRQQQIQQALQQQPAPVMSWWDAVKIPASLVLLQIIKSIFKL